MSMLRWTFFFLLGILLFKASSARKYKCTFSLENPRNAGIFSRFLAKIHVVWILQKSLGIKICYLNSSIATPRVQSILESWISLSELSNDKTDMCKIYWQWSGSVQNPLLDTAKLQSHSLQQTVNYDWLVLQMFSSSFGNFARRGGWGYLAQFLLGMCRWPLRTPTPL